MIEFEGCGVFTQLERALNISKVVVFKLDEAGDHLSQVLFVLTGACFVLCGEVAFLLDDAGSVIKWSARHEAFLTRHTALDVKDQTICREFLA